jgi:ABC-type branched-subunit amino acid transport system substrate-binding protein
LKLTDLSGREAVRLLVVALVAAGVAVGVVEATGGSGSHKASAHTAVAKSAAPAEGSAAASTTGGAASAKPGKVKVAAGPAVERSLRDGVLTVAIDTPSEALLAEQNGSIEHGAAVAAQELGASLPHHVHIKLLAETLDGLSATALKARLESQGAAALILPCDTASEQSLAAAGSSSGLLMLAPCSPDATAAERYPTYWSVGASSTQEASALVDYLEQDDRSRLFLVNATGVAYAEQQTSAFRSAARTGGIMLDGSASVSVSRPDFSSVVQAIEAIRPLPVAFFSALPPDLAAGLSSSLQAKGFHLTVFGSSVMDTPQSLARGKALENATFVSYGFARENAAASRFSTDYKTEFGKAPLGGFPGLGFETVRVLAAAARKAGSADPSAIQRALTDGLTVEGVGLASRKYSGGLHTPVGDVGISKAFSGELLPLLATTPPA